MSQHLDTYYENPALWHPGRYEGLDGLRVQEAVKWLPTNAHSILDVGCGNGVFANQLIETHTTIGVDRSWSALQWVQSPRAQADVTRLPFKAAAFDGLVCMEVLEHLPVTVFEMTLAELVRVTRQYLLITVPYCEDRAAVQVRCPVCSCQFHPTYHMRSFTRPQVERLLQNWSNMATQRVAGIVPTTRFRHQYLFRWLRQMKRKQLPFPKVALCPQCGYTTASDTRISSQLQQSVSGYRWWHRFWPKENSFVWWMALYEKRG